MSDEYMSEIRIMAFNFPPKGWALCNGQLLPINQNQALFSLLGTMYGGNGQTNFALPDLRGRTPIHVGGGFTQGEVSGQEAHTLTTSELPTHNHVAVADNSAPSANATFPNARLSNSSPANLYGPFASATAMDPGCIGNTGGSQAHNNMQPYSVLNFCICLSGLFPSRD
jgi:microcystin-dependent protein